MRLLEVGEEGEVVVETQKEFLVNMISYDVSYELWPVLVILMENPVNCIRNNFINGFAHLLSLPMHRIKIEYVVICCGWSGGGGRVVVVMIVVVVVVDVSGA
ncbi:hypothetical protein Tco_0289210 [Tanacetum coccineum]